MTRKGRYYLGRVVKAGVKQQKDLMSAILAAKAVKIGKFSWTITDTIDARKEKEPFVFGKLSKFAGEGHITVVDTNTRVQVDEIAPNLLVASSPFIYLPNFAGIAYLHVWNEIQEDIFKRRFKSIIDATYDNFFVDCSIEPISDYKAFGMKLKELDRVTEIEAKVNPPNPLFGKLWKPLSAYINKRNASEVKIREAQESGESLQTEVVKHVEGILENSDYEPAVPPDITDSALLMAADGYGMGKVIGYKDEQEIVIRTSDTQKSFLFSKDPKPDELAAEARKRFRKISDERDLKH